MGWVFHCYNRQTLLVKRVKKRTGLACHTDHVEFGQRFVCDPIHSPGTTVSEIAVIVSRGVQTS